MLRKYLLTLDASKKKRVLEIIGESGKGSKKGQKKDVEDHEKEEEEMLSDEEVVDEIDE